MTSRDSFFSSPLPFFFLPFVGPQYVNHRFHSSPGIKGRRFLSLLSFSPRTALDIPLHGAKIRSFFLMSYDRSSSQFPFSCLLQRRGDAVAYFDPLLPTPTLVQGALLPPFFLFPIFCLTGVYRSGQEAEGDAPIPTFFSISLSSCPPWVGGFYFFFFS